MKKNFTLIFTIILCLFYAKGSARMQFWSDRFEDVGAWTKRIAFYDSAADFTENIPGTDVTLQIRSNAFVNGGGAQEFTVDTFRLFETPICTAPVVTGNPSNIFICNGNNATFSVIVTGATDTKWQVDETGSGAYTDIVNGGVYSGATTNLLIISGVTESMTGYRYRAVAINEVLTCFTNSDYATLSVSNLTLTGTQDNILCIGKSNGSASVTATGGTGIYRYSWSPSGGSEATASGLDVGTYTVVVTDEMGCTAKKVFNIIETGTPIVITSSQNNVSCKGGSNGFARVTATGGTGTLTYSWSHFRGSQSFASGLLKGSYTVTVSDDNGCSVTKDFNITEPLALSINQVGVQKNVSCKYDNDGSATVAATGGTSPYYYYWSSFGGDKATGTGLYAREYSVSVTDSNGCSATTKVTITEPLSYVNVDEGGVQTNVSCNGGNDGSATVAPTGGTGLYTYSWYPSGGEKATASGLSKGFYTVTVTDANNCETYKDFEIIEPAANISSITRSGNILTADQAGATYQWFTCPGTEIDGEVGQSFTPTANGSYGVAITLNGCTVKAPCVDVTSLATVDFEEKSKFMIYPNPSQGIVTIKTDHDTDVSIINQSGQVVKTAKVTTDNINTINVENLSDGIYFIREMKDSKSATYKLILKK